jgi:hypothetical protein
MLTFYQNLLTDACMIIKKPKKDLAVSSQDGVPSLQKVNLKNLTTYVIRYLYSNIDNLYFLKHFVIENL